MLTVIISKRDIWGGAAKAAYRLHKGFNKIGIDSFMLVKDKKTHDDRVWQIKDPENKGGSYDLSIVNAVQHQYIDKNRTSLSNTKFTIPYPGYDLSELEIIKKADIINLHFIASFQSTESIRKLLLLGKYVVWTLHDQWAFTGGCHYSAGCEKYKYECKNCPQLENDPHNITSKIITQRRSLIDKSKLFIVTPSKWLALVALESYLFKELNIEVIPNSIETDVFCPVGDNRRIKKNFNISSEAVTILLCTLSENLKRKGFSKLLEAFEICYKNRKFRKLIKNGKIKLLCFGSSGSDIGKITIPYISFGKITNDYELRDIYNAADFFVLPSLEDNLPNTMLESMACSTPVVAFNIGGIPDLVTDHETGRLIPPYDVARFAEAILDLTFNKDKSKVMGYNSRKLIENNYTLQIQAQKYQDLFVRILSHQAPSCSSFSLQQNRSLICNLDGSFQAKFPGIYAEYSEKQKK